MFIQLPELYPSFDDKVAIHRNPAQVIMPSLPKVSTTTSKTVRETYHSIKFEGEHHFPGYQYLDLWRSVVETHLLCRELHLRLTHWLARSQEEMALQETCSIL